MFSNRNTITGITYAIAIHREVTTLQWHPYVRDETETV